MDAFMAALPRTVAWLALICLVPASAVRALRIVCVNSNAMEVPRVLNATDQVVSLW